ncbi:MAG: TetM/TetW/TetO/TetS family tetracycline resistance ribosomal protection protein [Spirochaetales bacterium]|nr:TetM/TetW/TetO/TetS family tetracycline resistance ribosomal protection protein [Spirochaetales bacterium]
MRLVTGIVANVDSGKTTLSESLLFASGAIRKMGRVDDKNSFLDFDNIERRRGITVYAKEAMLGDTITLIDTPGHVDFSSEMERSLSALDAAILIISAQDGVTGHTRTLWRLLEKHSIPTLIFLNKIDMPGIDIDKIKSEIISSLSDDIVSFPFSDIEEIAEKDDEVLEKYLSGEEITEDDISSIVSKRKLFPLLSGSALKNQGIDDILFVLEHYFKSKETKEEFGALLYKVSRDKNGKKLSHLKITGGKLKAKDEIGGEKVDEIRIYNGERYETVKEVDKGEVCAIVGLEKAKSGDTFGSNHNRIRSECEPVLVYSVSSDNSTDKPKLLRILKEVEEEFPEIKTRVISGDIEIMLMGEVQTEVICEIIQKRYGTTITLGEGKIAYKETILAPSYGIGHFEPLKHYAEVHLLLSPGERGSGLKFVTDLPKNDLDTNWQRLIRTHLEEKIHQGVLASFPITDITITLKAGRAHLKHTEGGDFREATYRAVRNALMKAESIILEPIYQFVLIVPLSLSGRALYDIERMNGTGRIEESSEGFVTIKGRCPVSTMNNYSQEVRAYTHGEGSLSVFPVGYERCHNEEEIIAGASYNPLSDLANPPGSVFCSHGAGFNVPWDMVEEYAHIEIVE